MDVSLMPPTPSPTNDTTFHGYSYLETMGMLGNMTSVIMFLLPLPIVVMMIKAHAIRVQDLQAHLVTLVNCSILIIYGIYSKNNFVFLHGIVGLVITLGYIIAIMYYGHAQQLLWDMLYIWMIGEILGVALVLAGTYSSNKSAKFSGVVCIIWAFVVHLVFELPPMLKIIKAQAVNYVPFFPMLFGVVDSLIWLLYGLALENFFLSFISIVGLLFGVGQLAVYNSLYTPANPPATSN